MSRFWKCPPLWVGATAYIVGGGPSLRDLDLSPLAGRKVIAVNNAYSLVPDAEFLFFADTRWWRWHKENLDGWHGRIVSTCKMGAHYVDPRILRMGRDYRYDSKLAEAKYHPLSEDRTALAGPDSGYMAINLAYLLGASRIVLLGFDMGFVNGEAHWHEDHEVPTKESNYRDLFLPTYPNLVRGLTEQGVEVLRCTPSRLACVPERSLAEVVALPERQRG